MKRLSFAQKSIFSAVFVVVVVLVKRTVQVCSRIDTLKKEPVYFDYFLMKGNQKYNSNMFFVCHIPFSHKNVIFFFTKQTLCAEPVL